MNCTWITYGLMCFIFFLLNPAFLETFHLVLISFF